MAGLPYVPGRAANYPSYSVFERLIWTSFSSEINRWRFRTLHLPHIYSFSSSWNLITMAKLPFSAMWSQSLLSKPEDWPEQCDVVGTFVVEYNQKNFDTEPFEDLGIWLANGPKPICKSFVVCGGAAKIFPARIMIISPTSVLSIHCTFNNWQ